MFDIETIIIHTALALVIVMGLSKVHEFIHIYMAKKLGVKINSVDWWKNEIDVEITRNDPRWKKLAYTPYYYLIPTGLALTMIGFYYQYFGLVVGGAGTVLVNLVSIVGEGREESCKQNVSVENQQPVSSVTETVTKQK